MSAAQQAIEEGRAALPGGAHLQLRGALEQAAEPEHLGADLEVHVEAQALGPRGGHAQLTLTTDPVAEDRRDVAKAVERGAAIEAAVLFVAEGAEQLLE